MQRYCKIIHIICGFCGPATVSHQFKCTVKHIKS